MNILLSDFKYAFFWGGGGVVIGLIAFGYNYMLVPASLPGYAMLTAPARFALSFFSEETAFWPKMAIFLVGQYIGYFALSVFASRLFSLCRSA